MKTIFLAACFGCGLFLLAACGADDSEKNKCQNSNDCTDGRTCNFDKQAQLGFCMKATTGGFFMCSTENPCPAGQFCFNGLCAPGCMTDNDCADNQYCDTGNSQLCLNKEVAGCTDKGHCAENQDCILGLCSAISEKKSCTPRPDGMDGCDDFSICLDTDPGEQEELACTSFPPCPKDGKCPVGLVGAVCNNEIIPQKGRMCLTGLCQDINNCPTQFKCITPDGSNLGMCSNGTMGMPCKDKTDCQDNLGCLTGPGMPIGFCIPGFEEDDCESSGGVCIDPMDECPDGTEIGTKQCSNMMQLCCL